MLEELKSLRKLREVIDIRKNIEADLEEKYQATPEYQKFIEAHNTLMELRQNLEALEKAIKEEAVKMSRNTGFEERDFGSVKIKEFTKVTITDQKLAVAWAGINAPSCLSLTKDFEKIAKTLELPFAKVEKEYRAQIASDLSGLTD